jgi:hypothetical protein
MEDHLTSLLFSVGAMLGVVGGVLVFRFGRRLEAEGRKVGFGFFSADAALMWLRPDRLPVTMRPFARQVRLSCLLFLWPGCVLLFLAWLSS